MIDVKEKIRRVHVGDNLQSLRMKAGLTQETLGKELGFTQSKISDLELTETISDELLQPFADFYGVSVSFLQKFNITDAEKSLISNTYNDAVNNTNEHAENTSANESNMQKTETNTNTTYNTTNYPIEQLTELYDRIIRLEKDLTLANYKLKEAGID